MREKLRWLLLAGLAVSPATAIAQEFEFPTINTIGRFLGMGYSHTGYHGRRDGRFDVIQARHPASDYRSGSLSYPYDPAYLPYRPVHTPPALAAPYQSYAAPATPTAAPELPIEEPEEVKPAKPVGPPPQWLKPHLKKPDTEVRDSSPSDREPTKAEVYGELTPPRQPSSQAESPFYIEPNSARSRSDEQSINADDTSLESELLSDDLLSDTPSGDDFLEDESLGEELLGEELLEEGLPSNADSGSEDLLDGGVEQEDMLNSDSEDLLLDDDELLLDDDDLSARRYLRRQPTQPRTATKPGLAGRVSVLQSPIPSAAPLSSQPDASQQRRATYARYQQLQPSSRTAQAGAPRAYEPHAGNRANATPQRFVGTPQTVQQPARYPLNYPPANSFAPRTTLQAAGYRQPYPAPVNTIRTAPARPATYPPQAQYWPQPTYFPQSQQQRAQSAAAHYPPAGLYR